MAFYHQEKKKKKRSPETSPCFLPPSYTAKSHLPHIHHFFWWELRQQALMAHSPLPISLPHQISLPLSNLPPSHSTSLSSYLSLSLKLTTATIMINQLWSSSPYMHHTTMIRGCQFVGMTASPTSKCHEQRWRWGVKMAKGR